MSKENEADTSTDQLKRTLKPRHMTMIAMGGAIGTGIFLAMGDSIHQAGVGGAFVAYGIIGVMVYFICTSLGEMATYLPESGSFGSYATKFIDPAMGFALGWNYWYSWAVTIAAELVAGSLVMKFWFPHVPAIVWSLLFLIIIVTLNLLSAKAYGEGEFWFSTIKVVTIIVFLLVGAAMMFIPFNGHDPVGFKNYFLNGGPFIGGFKSIFAILLIAGYSFQGTELVGLAAGESENPEKDVPKAVHTIFWRILLFYILTILVIGAIVPYASSGVTTSAFTVVFEKVGITGAASLMNLVILTAILSAGNSGMYASSRMLHAMAMEGKAHPMFKKTNKGGVPVNAIILTTIVSSLCFLTGIFSQNTVYLWLVAAAGLSGFIAWLGIAMCHYRFRKAYLHQKGSLDGLKYKATFYPFGPILAFAICFIITVGQGYAYFSPLNWGGLISSYISIPIFIGLYLYYKIRYKTKYLTLDQVDLRRLDEIAADEEKEREEREKNEK
ncbi:MAG: amino acid permease [Sarcina sp.]